MRSSPAGCRQRQRILSTILFTDIVDSTATAERLGDAAWRDLLAQHNERGRRELDRFRGREIDTTGDGFLALFDSSERAVRAAFAIALAAKAIGLQIRGGVHTGEVELVPGNVRGVAVHRRPGSWRWLARARCSTQARPTTCCWVRADIEDRGTHGLKGITGARQVYALVALGNT